MAKSIDPEVAPFSLCPLCGKPVTPTFDIDISGLLDLLTIAHEAIGEAKAALENEVLP